MLHFTRNEGIKNILRETYLLLDLDRRILTLYSN